MKNQTQTPIFIFAKWQVKNGELQTVLDLLPSVIEKSTAEEGNFFYKIFHDNAEPNTLILNESYRDMASIASHKNSHHYQGIAVKKIIPLLESREVILASELTFK